MPELRVVPLLATAAEPAGEDARAVSDDRLQSGKLNLSFVVVAHVRVTAREAKGKEEQDDESGGG